jgi:hypothetical protein
MPGPHQHDAAGHLSFPLTFGADLAPDSDASQHPLKGSRELKRE